MSLQRKQDNWIENRRLMMIQEGQIGLPYVNIWLPDKNGVATRIWSFNVYNRYLLYDYPILEKDWNNPDNPFLRTQSKYRMNEADYYNPDALHVGLLTQKAIDIIINATNGRGDVVESLKNTDGLVLYKPTQFERWDVVGDWERVITNKTTAATNKLPAILAAVTATIIG